jgi:putative MATE family efflux protein
MFIHEENLSGKDTRVKTQKNEEKSKGRIRILLQDLKDALRGTGMDYTQGSIGRAILLLSIPMILEMAMESTFAIVDIYFVSSLGASAVATVGLTESFLTIMYSIAMGLSMGATATVARRIGEKNFNKAADAAVQAVIVGLIASVPFTLAGLFFSKDLLSLMGGDAWVVNNGYRFTMMMLGGNAVIMLIFIMNAVFRGAGDAAIAMRILILSNSINIILDPLLIFGIGPFPKLGVEGAAVATTTGRGIAVLAQLYLLLHGGKHIKVLVSQIRINFKVMINLIRTSLGGISQFIIATVSWIGLMRIVSVFGSEALAGYTIAMRIFIFTLMPSWGMANAAATLVGQNLGAQQPERAERSVWITGFANMMFLAIVSVVYITFNHSLMRIFTSDPGVIKAGAECLRIVSYGYIFYALGMVMLQSFNGAGDTMTPTKINLVCFWLFEIPFAYLLALKLGAGETGVYWSIVITESIIAIISMLMFRKGKWKKVQV